MLAPVQEMNLPGTESEAGGRSPMGTAGKVFLTMIFPDARAYGVSINLNGCAATATFFKVSSFILSGSFTALGAGRG